MELENYTKEVNGIEYNVKIVLDDSPDLSWLGTLTDKTPECNYIDKKEGLFIGFDGYLSVILPNDKFKPYSEPTESDVVTYLENKLNMADVEICDLWLDADSDSPDSWQVYFYGREVLANVKQWYNRNSYRYYYSMNGLNPRTSKEELKEYSKEERLKWAIQDYERLYGYDHNRWYMTGIIVELGDISESLWGIESDADDDYKESVISDLIYQVNQRVPDYVQELRERANHLESISTILK